MNKTGNSKHLCFVPVHKVDPLDISLLSINFSISIFSMLFITERMFLFLI